MTRAALRRARGTAAVLLLAAAGLAQAQPARPEPVQAQVQVQVQVQVMVLGTYHFGNPGQDLHNVRVDDVLAPRRQAELRAVVQALAAFEPQRIAVEREPGPDAGLASYRAYLAGEREQVRNEIEQIGFRLARELGLASVQGIDMPGEFPFGAVQAYAQRRGRGAELQAQVDRIGERVRSFEAAQRSTSIGRLLRRLNEPAAIADDHAWTMGLLAWGDGAEQPGQRLVAAWHARNLAICARLVQQVQPGERVLVVYGSGHAHLLRRCVAEMPGWRLVDPLPYLPDT